MLPVLGCNSRQEKQMHLIQEYYRTGPWMFTLYELFLDVQSTFTGLTFSNFQRYLDLFDTFFFFLLVKTLSISWKGGYTVYAVTWKR